MATSASVWNVALQLLWLDNLNIRYWKRGKIRPRLQSIDFLFFILFSFFFGLYRWWTGHLRRFYLSVAPCSNHGRRWLPQFYTFSLLLRFPFCRTRSASHFVRRRPRLLANRPQTARFVVSYFVEKRVHIQFATQFVRLRHLRKDLA